MTGEEPENLRNYIGGTWIESSGARTNAVRNPATGEVLCEVPISGQADVDRATSVAAEAFQTWRKVPALARSRTLFRFKDLIEKNFEEIARTITREQGKTLDESRGSLRRGLENVAHACAAQALLLGDSLGDVAAGVDVTTHLEPIGVFAAMTPSNFPAMVPLWFLPYAVATGNTFILKPSSRVPATASKLFELAHEAGFPAGVVGLVHGDDQTGRDLVAHEAVAGVSFVGGSDAAREVYRTAAERGKRVQAFGGANNHLVVMTDANLERTVSAILDSCFGCAGQRCLAGSVVIAVGEIYEQLERELTAAAKRIVIGDGLDSSVEMGPVQGGDVLDRVSTLIGQAIAEGARPILDGRQTDRSLIKGASEGAFIGPTILSDVSPASALLSDEVFGPVMILRRAESLTEAIATVNQSPYANATAIFTQSGKSAREFRAGAEVSMVGVNIGVTAPVAAFPFGGAKNSFFGDLKAQGRDAIRFFTDQKVVISRWF